MRPTYIVALALVAGIARQALAIGHPGALRLTNGPRLIIH